MILADFTCPGLIVPELRGHDVTEVLQELSRALHQEGRVPDMLPFYHAALNREFLVSTALQPGLAFPHARLAGLSELSFALGRSAQPVAWGPRSGQPVRLIFLLAVPATDSTQYLQVISGLARFAGATPLLAKLHEAADALAMFELLRQVPLRNKPKSDPTGKTMTSQL